jgi:hypothetical protein
VLERLCVGISFILSSLTLCMTLLIYILLLAPFLIVKYIGGGGDDPYLFVFVFKCKF